MTVSLPSLILAVGDFLEQIQSRTSSFMTVWLDLQTLTFREAVEVPWDPQ